MIQHFVKQWESRKNEVRALFAAKHPADYSEVVRNVISILTAEDDHYVAPDVGRIHEIDDGEYQGTLVYVIGAQGYQPSVYWSVFVDYGSCSGCDTLQAIHGYSAEPPNEEQVNEYMTLALHIVQGLKRMGEPNQ